MSLAEKLQHKGRRETKRVHELQLRMAAQRAELQDARRQLGRVQDNRDELQAALDRLAALGETPPGRAVPLSRKTRKGSAIAIAHYSDWHVGELVDAQKTGGRNEFNPEVARGRSRKLARSTIRLLRLKRQIWNIDQLLLVLGGDFLTGHLHDELRETNTMGPMEEMLYAAELLGDALETLAQHGELKRIHVVCHRGNHARTTRRMQFKNDFETSYETGVYWHLRQRHSDRLFRWEVPKSDVHYTELVPGHHLRTHHGHQVKYSGGIGGVQVPLTRWIVRQDQTQHAVMTVLGHFHSYNPSSIFDINGSLKGWDELSQSHGFAYEPPTQSWMLFDTHRCCITSRNPIFCE